MALNTYVVEGGIGKCVAFTAVIPKLSEKSGNPIQIYTPYIDCFAMNPHVGMAFEQSLPITDPRIQKSDNIFFCEPYKSNFALGRQHIIESFCELLGVQYDKTMVPKIYTSQHKKLAEEWRHTRGITGKYMLVQFSGGQTPVGWTPTNQYNSLNPARNYPAFLAQKVVDQLRAKFPDVAIIDCTLANEPGYAGTVKGDVHWAVIHELMKDAQGFISIDSCMNHFSPSAQKRGVVLWGSTRWTQFGYDKNINMHFHMDGVWDESRFDAQDPRNIMIDPERVVQAYEAVIGGRP